MALKRRSRQNPALGLEDLSTTLPFVKPEDAGVTINGTPNGNSAKLQSQIDALNAAGGGVIRVTPGSRIWLDATVTLKEGVWIDGGGGSKQTGTKQSSVFIADHTISTGWIFDTPNVLIKGCGISNCQITTDMSTPSSIVLGGIRFQKVVYGILEHLSVGNVTDTAVKLAGGTGCIVADVGGGYVPQGRTLTQPTGVLHVNGTDHIIKDCEFFANTTTITYSQLWQCAVYVNCLTSWFLNNEAEFGECGWYIDGPQSGGSGLGTSGAYLCRWISSRATYNAGHGFYIAGAASYNEFVAPYVYNCSYAGDGLYDGFNIANGAVATRVGKLSGFSNTAAGQGGPGPGGRFYMMRYLYNDLNAAYTGDQANKVDDVWGQLDNYTVDTVNIASGALPSKQGGGAATSGNRERSRYRAGQGIYDLTLNKYLISTGTKWIEPVAGKLTQINQLPPTYSECRQPTGATGPTSTVTWTTGKGTLSVVNKISQSAAVQLNATPQLLKIVADAAAVTAGECDFSTGVLSIAVDPTQDFSVGGYFIEGTVSSAGAATVGYNIAWYTSGAAFISATTTATTSVSNTTPVKVAVDTLAASIPGTAAIAVITPIITKSGMVAGVDTFFATNFWAVQGAQLNYIAP